MDKRRTVIRLVIDLLIAFFIINGWWFLALLLALYGLWKFQYFVECIIFGIAFDSLFGFMKDIHIYSYLGTIIGFVTFISVVLFKNMVRK